MAEAKIEETDCRDRISELPEDLLVRILGRVPTKDAVITMFLSKRWLSIWTMLPTLEYIDKDYEEEEGKKSVWWFLDKSLQHHNAPVIHNLCMELGSGCPTSVDVGKWVAKAVDRRVLKLTFKLLWSANPTRLPECLYTCETLVELNLSNKILVDFSSSSPCLPSLRTLKLYFVVYKDEDSLLSLLSSCHVLKYLMVRRKNDDNVKKFTIKVPSLLFLYYASIMYYDIGHTGRCVVIDTPALKHFRIFDTSGDSGSVNYMTCLEKAYFSVESYPDDRLLRSLSSVLSLELLLNDETLVCCKAINFSRLTRLIIYPQESDWPEPLMLLLKNAQKLRHLVVDYERRDQSKDLPLSWNQPSCVPGCLSSHLEIFEWRKYIGDRKEEKEFLTYILAHSKHLKTATISLSPTIDLQKQELIKVLLKDIPRVSTTSQLLFK